MLDGTFKGCASITSEELDDALLLLLPFKLAVVVTLQFHARHYVV